jgi:hypothetical protein
LIRTRRAVNVARIHHFPFFGAFDGLPAFFAAVRAVSSAIAIACFCGLPDFISLEMFELIDFWL